LGNMFPLSDNKPPNVGVPVGVTSGTEYLRELQT
jgi:hypothetical protein